MKLHILFGQRRNSYPGQYAPEALEFIDEYGMEENPYWLIDKREGHLGSREFSNVEIICVDLGEDSMAKVVEILNPKHMVTGEIRDD